jgi:succinate dehydrogenase/fumarate reductase-like Fe-S protein
MKLHQLEVEKDMVIEVDQLIQSLLARVEVQVEVEEFMIIQQELQEEQEILRQ